MKLNICFWAVLCGSALFACGGSGEQVSEAETDNDTLTCHARYLTMAERPDGVVLVDIADPWKDNSVLGRYALVDRDSVLPDDLPAGVSVIRTPVERAAVYSSVHTGAMNELGVIGALSAVADTQFLPPTDTVATLLKSGTISDAGAAQNPSTEVLAATRSEIVLRSPMQGVSSPALPSGLVPVECVDYMEDTPIGRAEWLLLLGQLFGKETEARSIFDGVIDRYSELVFKVGASQIPKPKILVETETSGVWYVPAGKSYAARLYADAGADYPWTDTDGQGSLALSLEEVASKALDADIWLVRSYGYETTPQTLKALNPRYASFKALKEGRIYSCDSSKRLMFSETVYHPELILADYISIFHPDVLPDYKPRYFLK